MLTFLDEILYSMLLASEAQNTSSASILTELPTNSIQKTTETTTTTTTYSTMLTMNNNGTSGTTSVPSSTIPVGVSSNTTTFTISITGDETSTQTGAGIISVNIFIGISQVAACTFQIVTGNLYYSVLHLSNVFPL